MNNFLMRSIYVVVFFISFYSYGQTQPVIPELPPIEMIDTIRRDSIFPIPIAPSSSKQKPISLAADQQEMMPDLTEMKKAAKSKPLSAGRQLPAAGNPPPASATKTESFRLPFPEK